MYDRRRPRDCGVLNTDPECDRCGAKARLIGPDECPGIEAAAKREAAKERAEYERLRTKHETSKGWPMLYQIHWQDKNDLTHTEFVAQADFEEGRVAEFDAWVRDVFARRGGEMPAGFTPLVVTQGCDLFVWAAAPPVAGGPA